MKTFLPSIVIGLVALTGNASAAPIADYNADDQSLGAITTFTDTTTNHNATGTGTVLNTGTVFNGHNYVDITGGFLTSTALYSGSQSRTVAAVYANPFGDNGGINPVAGEEGPQNYGLWFALQARSLYAAGDPYLVNAGPDVSSGGSPVANRLTFALATYDGTVETLYWAYGTSGAVRSTSVTVSLNTNVADFGIGTSTNEVSEGNMDIGQVLVYNNALTYGTNGTDGTAAAEIRSLQAYYAASPEVPEPSTWAMMLGGMAFLAICIRRTGDRFRA
jgi:hypothetical protein